MLIIFINKLVNSIKSKRDKTIIFYYNNRILELMRLLEKNNYIRYKLINRQETPSPEIELSIVSSNIKNLTFISKPSRTVHIKYTKLLTVAYDCILSTNQGLITKKHALELGIGGILLLKIHV
jgi:ribosomal protein S8